jgi:imidazolonepropionase-like amidohydrolase
MKTKRIVVVGFLAACSSVWMLQAQEALVLMPTNVQQPPKDEKPKPTEPAKLGDAAKSGDTAKSTDATKSTEPIKKSLPKEVLAIVGGDIITVSRERIRGGTILIEDGKITAVGQNVKVPEGANKIDAHGKTVTPGFVAVDVGRMGMASGSAGSDRNAKVVDTLDPFDRNLMLALGVGITTGCVEIRTGGGGFGRRGVSDGFPVTERFLGFDPDIEEDDTILESSQRDYGPSISLCKCCGLPIIPTEPIENTPEAPATQQKNVVIKMSFGKLDGMLVNESAFLDMTPGSMSGALGQHNWREQIAKAKKYLADQTAHEKAIASGKREQPPRKPVSDEILRLVKREIPLRIAANTISDIRDQVGLSKELGYKVVLTGAAEAWAIPEELAEAGAEVVYAPRRRRAPRFGEEKTSGTWIEMSRVLEQTGVPFALSTLSNAMSLDGIAGRDLSSLPLEAAFAVRGGASEKTALEALTITPAKMMGLDKRIGSIEVGKDADILLLDGNPLDYRTYVDTAIVNGRVAYKRSDVRVLPN